ncbi:MAG: argininosuccinate synthase [Acidobacteria bacterium]|nr:argininosuccinate synthase [Acidobacteriota bacterium]
MTKVVLAYSGDLVTSAALAWLLENGAEDVATVTVDLGQGRDLNDVRDRALGIGAARAHVLDVRAAFARQAVVPAYQWPLSEPRAAALARPFIAKHTLEVAQIEGATAIAHGSAFPSDDPQGLEAAFRAAGVHVPMLAPARDWQMNHAALIGYGRDRGIPVPSTHTRDVIEVRNLWGRSVTTDALNTPNADPPADLFVLTRTVEEWAKEPSVVDIAFVGGVPVSLNGVEMPLVDLIVSLDTIAGAHGIGQLDYPALDGVRSRTLEEAPASLLLHQALAALEGADGRIRFTCFMGDAKREGQ